MVSLQYLSLTRPGIALNTNKLAQHLHLGKCSANLSCLLRCRLSSSRKQCFVAHSSIEAEYKALADTASELQWVLSLFTELGHMPTTNPVIYCDNVGATNLSANPFRVSFVSTDDQLADILTKPMLHPWFDSLLSKLHLSSRSRTREAVFGSHCFVFGYPLLRRGVFDSEGVYSVPEWMYSVSLEEFAWKLCRYGAILFDKGEGCKVEDAAYHLVRMKKRTMRPMLREITKGKGFAPCRSVGVGGEDFEGGVVWEKREKEVEVGSEREWSAKLSIGITSDATYACFGPELLFLSLFHAQEAKITVKQKLEKDPGNSKEAAIYGRQLANGECVTTLSRERNKIALKHNTKKANFNQEKKEERQRIKKSETITDCRKRVKEEVPQARKGRGRKRKWRRGRRYQKLNVAKSRRRRLFTMRRLSAWELGEEH
ncbi:hypothetical protein V8G54_009496 [Vigna mungo]|uniref:Uncharacterized protein n=1 Tax=Vigna mungo TaxID=3915 RepID=A0AAQ3NUX6_VIGMU